MTEENYNNVLIKAQNKLKEKEINDYNEVITELILKPKNWGRIPENETSVSQSYKGPCGDTIRFFLKIKDNIIKDAKFFTTGCGASIAAASQTTMMIQGKSLEYAENLKPNEVDKTLGGLPDDHKHCAELAIRTLRNAIKKYKLAAL
jgi:NifU-like protein involved in Fe-S cluster formation